MIHLIGKFHNSIPTLIETCTGKIHAISMARYMSIFFFFSIEGYMLLKTSVKQTDGDV